MFRRLLAALVILPALVACKPKERPASAAEAGGASILNSWAEVHEVTRCASMSPDQCLGYFGFSVRSDGEYIVGAADGGTPAAGTVTPGELERLNGIVQNLTGQNLPADMQCENSPLETADRDSIDVTLTNESNYLVYDNEGPRKDLCVRGDQDAVRRLHRFIRTLLEKYYPANIY